MKEHTNECAYYMYNMFNNWKPKIFGKIQLKRRFKRINWLAVEINLFRLKFKMNKCVMPFEFEYNPWHNHGNLKLLFRWNVLCTQWSNDILWGNNFSWRCKKWQFNIKNSIVRRYSILNDWNIEIIVMHSSM